MAVTNDCVPPLTMLVKRGALGEQRVLARHLDALLLLAAEEGSSRCCGALVGLGAAVPCTQSAREGLLQKILRSSNSGTKVLKQLLPSLLKAEAEMKKSGKDAGVEATVDEQTACEPTGSAAAGPLN